MTSRDLKTRMIKSPCITCAKKNTHACRLGCEKLEGYIPPPELKDHVLTYNDSYKKNARDEIYEMAVYSQPEEDLSPISDHERMERLIKQAHIFRECEVKLSNQFNLFMGCKCIANLAKLSGDSKQNLAKKLSRRIHRLDEYLHEHYRELSDNDFDPPKKALASVGTPREFKRNFHHYFLVAI